MSIPMDREILHVIPQEFVVDDQKGIKDPIGMCGVRLETQVHIITGAVTSAQNIYKSVDKAGLKVIDLVLEPLASCYAVLEKDEKELGVALVDMGGGTTDIAIYFDESIVILRWSGLVVKMLQVILLLEFGHQLKELKRSRNSMGVRIHRW